MPHRTKLVFWFAKKKWRWKTLFFILKCVTLGKFKTPSGNIELWGVKVSIPW